LGLVCQPARQQRRRDYRSTEGQNRNPVSSSRNLKGLLLKWFKFVSTDHINTQWLRRIGALIACILCACGFALCSDSRRLDGWLSDNAWESLGVLFIWTGDLIFGHFALKAIHNG